MPPHPVSKANNASRSPRAAFVCITVAVTATTLCLTASTLQAQERVYTSNADFDEGALVGVNHDVVANQLQLDESVDSFGFVWVAASGRRTIVRFDASTGEILGEYRTAPAYRSASPSRTAVDDAGNVWVGNRAESADGMGSVLKIGLVVGGTRGHKNPDGSFTPDPSGGYLAPPFVYSTAVDRDGDGLIRTSSGIGDVLSWPDGTDGTGGETAEVRDALDECILLYQRTSATDVHHVSIDPSGDVWVGGYANGSTGFERIDAQTGRIVSSVMPSCGGYGGVVDENGVVWSASFSQNTLLRYDPATGASQCVSVQQAAGVVVDTNGNVWSSMWDRNMIAKVSPDGAMMPGFPKLTGGRDCFGVAVTPADGHVWVANKRTNDVSRLDPDGNIVNQIPTGLAPTGVDVDRDGFVWVTNQNDHNAVRIDPNGGADGLGAVDLVVPLGPRASPIGYGEMSVGLDVHNLTELGSWTVVYDSETDGMRWGTVTWDGSEPALSTLRVHVRASDSASNVETLPWRSVERGVGFAESGVVGRFIQVRVTFLADAAAGLSPVLRSLRVQAAPESNDAPDCSGVAGSVEELWPPDGRMVAIDILGLVDPDGDDVTCRITGITQDEPLDPGEDGAPLASASGVGEATAYVRAARQGYGNGRVYEIHYVASDGRGGDCTGSVYVCVPHDQGMPGNNGVIGGCADDGQLFDATAGTSDKPGVVSANSPNPFNPRTTIQFVLPTQAEVDLRVYDASGRHVRTLTRSSLGAGSHRVVWDGRDEHGQALASGVYIYRLHAGNSVVSKRMLLLK